MPAVVIIIVESRCPLSPSRLRHPLSLSRLRRLHRPYKLLIVVLSDRGDSLIGSSSLSCATLVAPSPLVCRPLHFAESLIRRLHLLSRYCAPLVQLVVVLPGGLPPPLSRRPRLSSRLSIRWLSRRVASHHIVWRLGRPFPFHHASASRCAPLVRLVVASCCLAPRPLSPSYRRARNAAVVVIDIVAIGSSGGIITIAVAVAIAVSAIAVIAVIWR